jgi:hypothetical protein
MPARSADANISKKHCRAREHKILRAGTGKG